MDDARAVSSGGVGTGLYTGGALGHAALAAALSLSLAGAAGAQPLDNVSREAATSLGVVGIQADEAGSYLDALDKLEKSYNIARVPTLGLWSARAMQKLGRWLEAEQRYQEAVGLPIPEGDLETQRQAVAQAQAELDALTPAIPRLVIEVQGARIEQLQLRIDGRVVAATEAVQRLNPGPHHVEGVRGDARLAVDVDLVPSDSRSILLRFPPAPDASEAAVEPAPEAGERSDWLRTSGWSAVGVGGAGVALGTVALVLAIQKKDEIDHDVRCREDACAPSARALVGSYDARRNLSTVGFLAGGALLGLGVGALVLAADGSDDPRAEAVFSPSFVGIRGKF